MASIVVFVEGPLYNPMNGSHGHWSKRARWARQWRERAGMTLLAGGARAWVAQHRTTTPKDIAFLLHTFNRVDTDALGPMVKPCRDALMDAGIIASDGPDAGHTFTYSQRIDRAHRGVRITIEPRT
jgi:hypothetical protein